MNVSGLFHLHQLITSITRGRLLVIKNLHFSKQASFVSTETCRVCTNCYLAPNTHALSSIPQRQVNHFFACFGWIFQQFRVVQFAGCSSSSSNMSDARFECGYAKLGTSSCKKCKQKIEKGSLRIAKVGYLQIF